MRKVLLMTVVVISAMFFIFSLNCKGSDDKQKSGPDNKAKGETSNVAQVRASHILIPFQGAQKAPQDAKSKDEALKLSKDLVVKIKGGGNFEELAKQNSSCPSKEKGGDLGKFGKGAMVPAFETAAFGLKVGDVTPEPVETPFGFHIIKRTE